MEIEKFGALSPPARTVHFRGTWGAVTLAEALTLSFGQNLKQSFGSNEGTFFEPTPESAEKRARWLIDFGAVYVNKNRVTDGSLLLTGQDIVRVHLDPKRYSLNLEDLNRRIIFQNEHFVVVDKPSGLPMHPTLDNLRENLVCGFDFPVFVTHRLDVPTSGLVVLAKTKTYQSLFNQLVARREIQKLYEAQVEKPMEPGLLRHFMKVTVKAPKEVIREIPLATENRFDECLMKILECRPLESVDGISPYSLSIELLTGRTHQIRAQLAFEGNPLFGDEMYGGPSWDTFGLRAVGLKFVCPVENRTYSFVKRQVKPPLPPDCF